MGTAASPELLLLALAQLAQLVVLGRKQSCSPLLAALKSRAIQWLSLSTQQMSLRTMGSTNFLLCMLRKETTELSAIKMMLKSIE